MKKNNFSKFLFFFLISVVFSFKIVKADTADYSKLAEIKCKPGEVEVTCKYTMPDGWLHDSSLKATWNNKECENYSSDPNYRYMGSDGSTFGGVVILCKNDLKASILNLVKSLFLALSITLVIEILILLFFKMGKKIFIKKVLVINLITVTLLNIILFIIPFNTPQISLTIMMPGMYKTPILLVFMEIIVILVEYLYYKRNFKSIENISLIKIFFYTVTANLFSWILGSFTLVTLIMYLPIPLPF